MKVEISKDQREIIGEKVALCLDFLKKQIQPHLAPKDLLTVGVDEVLDLCISREEIYVLETKVISLGIDFYPKNKWYLEVIDRKKAKKYIVEARPELAVGFLKKWDNTKLELLKQVNEKNSELDKLNKFVDEFRL